LGPQIAASAMNDPSILEGAAGTVLGTGYDPQSALYNQTAQQTANQTNANLAASGLSATPYGASVLGNTMQNFNMNWENQQLQRQIQASQAAGALMGQAQGLQTGGLTGLQAGALGADAQTQQSINDYLQYAQAATAQNQVNVQAYQAMAQAANQAQSNAQQASQAGLGAASQLGGGLLGAAGSMMGK
jgi:hypothetical protein